MSEGQDYLAENHCSVVLNCMHIPQSILLLMDDWIASGLGLLHILLMSGLELLHILLVSTFFNLYFRDHVLHFSWIYTRCGIAHPCRMHMFSCSGYYQTIF